MAQIEPEELQHMHEEVLQRMELLDVLYAFAPQVQSPLEVAGVMQVTATTVQGILAGEWCALLTDEGDRGLKLGGFSGDLGEEARARLEAADMSALTFASGELAPRWIAAEDGPPWLVVPMALRGANVGVIVVGYPPGTPRPDAGALELAQGISRQSAIALENARLVLQIKEEQQALAEANASLKQREAELQLLNSRLAEASRLKSEFLARMSHELRTPLNAIIGFSEALLSGLDGPLNDEQRESLGYIHKGGTHLLQLINDLLDLSKIEAGRLTIQPEDVVLADLIGPALEGLRPLAQAKGLELLHTVEPSLPVLFTDPRRVSQILLNLVGNAIKFTQSGAVRVSAVPFGASAFELAVTDTGIGIPPDKLDVIFEEFTQVEGVAQRQAGGTGLGLAICKKLAELLGGTIAVESTVGVGSTFRVCLPLRYGDRVEETSATPAGTKVLLIDDDPAIHRLVEKALAGTSFDLVSVRRATEGLQRVREVRPAAVILDLLMPDLDGWQLLRSLERDPATRATPVIVLTVLEEAHLPRDVAGYLSKPLQPDRLVSLLNQVTNRDGGNGLGPSTGGEHGSAVQGDAVRG